MGHGTSEFTASWSHMQVTAGFVINTWRYDSPQRLSPPLWDLGHLCGFSVRSELTPRCPVGLRELGTVGDPACLESGTNPKLTLLYHLCLLWGSGLCNYIMWGRALRTPFQFSASSEFLAESGTWLSELWQKSVLSWSCHSHAVCCGASHLLLPHLNRETRLWEFFERITSHEYKSLQIDGQRCPFSTKMF